MQLNLSKYDDLASAKERLAAEINAAATQARNTLPRIADTDVITTEKLAELRAYQADPSPNENDYPLLKAIADAEGMPFVQAVQTFNAEVLVWKTKQALVEKFRLAALKALNSSNSTRVADQALKTLSTQLASI